MSPESCLVCIIHVLCGCVCVCGGVVEVVCADKTTSPPGNTGMNNADTPLSHILTPPPSLPLLPPPSLPLSV